MRSKELDDFVRSGFARYLDAREAVDTFEREVKDCLCDLLEEKRDWEHFTPGAVTPGERGRGKTITHGTWAGANGRTIYVTIAARKEADGWVELALWWGAPRKPDGVVVYGARMYPGYKPQELRLTQPRNGVACESLDGGKPRLVVPLDEGSDLGDVGAALLGELDRALGESEST